MSFLKIEDISSESSEILTSRLFIPNFVNSKKSNHNISYNFHSFYNSLRKLGHNCR